MIKDQQVKELVNRLIDLASENKHEFTQDQMFWRQHGIELAIDMINGRLLNEMFRQSDSKHDVQQSLLKTA